jgi:hypothetical protein
MAAVSLVKHLLNILHGASASLACFSLLSLAGLAVLTWWPRVSQADRSPQESSGSSIHPYPAVLGGALFTLWCWYGEQLDLRLTTLVATFGAAVVVLSVTRWRRIGAILRADPLDPRGLIAWTCAFGLFYVVAYLFFTPDVSGRRLPLATYLNNDLMNYLNFTRAFQERGPSNVAGLSFLTAPQYLQTPAAFYVIALVAAFFRNDAMHAAMPLQFTLSAIIALLATRVCRSVFRAPWPWALAFGATAISGPFFRYVAGNYFLSTLITVPVLLNLLWTTVVRNRGGPRFNVPLAVEFGAHYVLLLLTYPILLVIGVAVQGATVLIAAVPRTAAGAGSAAWRDDVAELAGLPLSIALGLVLMAVAVPQHVLTAGQSVLYLSQRGIAGWPMAFISPLALFGFPGHFDRVQLQEPVLVVYAMGSLATVAAVLLFAYFWVFRRRATLEERLYVAVGAMSLLLYCAAFSRLGPSYQQWKLASYLTGPLSFITFAAIVRMFQLATRAGPGHAARRRTATNRGLAVLFALVFVGGNLRMHMRVEPPPWTFSAAFANLQVLDELPFVRQIYVEMKDVRTTFLPVYFIRSKELHLISPSYYPREPLPLDRISPATPYLLQDFGCDGVGHSRTMTIEGVGCLMFDPPSPELDTSYPFNRTFHFVVPVAGIGPRESWGRWNNRRQAQLRVRADSIRVPTGEPLYLNLRVAPYLPPGRTAQRVVLLWGASRAAQESVSGEAWIAVPLQPSDWTGGRVKTLTIDVQTPDATVPAEVEAGSHERRPLAIAFKDLVLSTTPRGRLVPPVASSKLAAASAQ